MGSNNDSIDEVRTLIVGAGVSGLVSLKSVIEAKLGYSICYEQSENVNEDRGSVCKTTVVNTSKETMCFSDFLWSDDTPNYPTHEVVHKYLENYANEFDLFDCIKFQRKVIEIKRFNDKFTVSSKDTLSSNIHLEIFDYVMICNGRHYLKKLPQFSRESDFKGRVIHSHEFRDPTMFKDSRVCIVGIGNTAVDIAVDLSKICPQVYLSTKKGSYVLNRTGDVGLPIDLLTSRRIIQQIIGFLPKCLIDRMGAHKANQYFDHDLYGLTPKHGFSEVHTTVNDDICNRIITGEVKIKPDIKHFTESGVVFTDGCSVDIDIVVYATGYLIDMPFLDDSIITIEDNSVEMYRKIFLPDVQGMAFVGLVQPLGPVFPVCEMQARYAVQVFKKNVLLPGVEKMRQSIAEDLLRRQRLYSHSSRHTLQCEWFPYMQLLAGDVGCRPSFCSALCGQPLLAFSLCFGVLSPCQYRLRGPHAWSGARRALYELRLRVETPFGRRRALGRVQTRRSRVAVVVLWLVGFAGLVVCYVFLRRTTLFGI